MGIGEENRIYFDVVNYLEPTLARFLFGHNYNQVMYTHNTFPTRVLNYVKLSDGGRYLAIHDLSDECLLLMAPSMFIFDSRYIYKIFSTYSFNLELLKG